MYKILFDKEKTEIKSINEVDMWPGEKNAYDIELNITHRNGLVPGKNIQSKVKVYLFILSQKKNIILQFI